MVKITAGERMAAIEEKTDNIQKQLETHCKEQRDDFKTVFIKLDELNGRFAGKWVEKVTTGVLITIIAGIIIFAVTGGI